MTNTTAQSNSTAEWSRQRAVGLGPAGSVRERIGHALTGDAGTPLVWLGNFEVEDRWAVGEIGVPHLEVGGTGRQIVNQLDEFALLLGDATDHVVVKSPPDPDYLRFLTELSFPLPTVLYPTRQDARHVVTEDALADPQLRRKLAELGRLGHRLVPHGVSDLEERLAADTALRPAVTASVCKAVNSKIYSRIVAAELGLRQADGHTCDTVAEFTRALRWARGLVESGRRVVVKDAFGVSGKGVMVVSDPGRLDRLGRLVAAAARRAGTEVVSLVVEEWVAKRADLNYHVTIGVDGSVSFDFVLEAITEHGVHRGHRLPARITPAQRDELADVAGAIGRRLARDGYRGPVGVDAMIDPSGGLYPIVEINARNNMSTYQAACCQRLVGAGSVALARHYSLRLAEPLPFARLRDALGPTLYQPSSRRGLAVNTFATVNACFTGPPERAAADGALDGRLYGIVVAETPEQLAALDGEVGRRLATLGRDGRP